VKAAFFKKETFVLRSRRLCGTLTDYHILKTIGKGGYGEVYLCRKKSTNELLALKRIPKEKLKNKNQIAHAQIEQNILVSII